MIGASGIGPGTKCIVALPDMNTLAQLGRGKRPLTAILLISIILRVAAAIYLDGQSLILPGTYDQVSYHNLALRVLDGHGFSFDRFWWPITRAGEPTAHWSYPYTLFLTAVYWLFGPHTIVARLIQAIAVGLLHPLVTYHLGERIFGRRVGLVAAALTAVYAYFVYYSGTLMTEAFYITAILGSMYLAVRLAVGDGQKTGRLVVLLGLALGTTVLLRQLYLIFVPVLFLWWWWVHYRRARKFPIWSTIQVGLILAAMIIPFTIYNYLRFDRFVLLNTNAGFALFWGNHPIYGTRFEPILSPEVSSYEALIPVEFRQLDEAALEQALMKRGLQFIRDDPIRFIQLSLSRIPAYFMFWPSAESGTISNFVRVASFGLLWPFMLYGLIMCFLRRTRLAGRLDLALFLVLFAGVYTLIHLLVWALVRYRLPVDAVMIIFAGLALADVVQRIDQLSIRWKAERTALS
jgi:4-amino-4-deoxy-L-arabinose transferase-like glycosyltransferase